MYRTTRMFRVHHVDFSYMYSISSKRTFERIKTLCGCICCWCIVCTVKPEIKPCYCLPTVFQDHTALLLRCRKYCCVCSFTAVFMATYQTWMPFVNALSSCVSQRIHMRVLKWLLYLSCWSWRVYSYLGSRRHLGQHSPLLKLELSLLQRSFCLLWLS